MKGISAPERTGCYSPSCLKSFASKVKLPVTEKLQISRVFLVKRSKTGRSHPASLTSAIIKKNYGTYPLRIHFHAHEELAVDLRQSAWLHQAQVMPG